MCFSLSFLKSIHCFGSKSGSFTYKSNRSETIFLAFIVIVLILGCIYILSFKKFFKANSSSTILLLKHTTHLSSEITSFADKTLYFFKLDSVFLIKSSNINLINFLTSSYFNLLVSFFFILIVFTTFFTMLNCSNSSILKKFAYNPSSISLLL